jgi:hypothetical protein
MVDVAGPILRTLDYGPVPVELDELAAGDDPQEAGTSEVLEWTSAVAPEQG